MAIDYSQCAIPKGTPRVLDRIQRKRDLDKQERDCRAAVRRRDHGKCVVPSCKESAKHLHHIQYRSLGGKWRTANVCSLCARHHQMQHAALIDIQGNADEHLTITGDARLLRFRL